MIRSLRERLTTPRAPVGYRPGVTLGHLARNLGQPGMQWLAPGAAVIQLPGGRAEVRERVESHLLMHVVACEFVLCVPALQQGDVRLQLRHTGALRRSGLACVLRSGDKTCFARVRDGLLANAALQAALMPLDFKRLTLECSAGQWRLVLEHMGGSEVVNRLPAFRRYIQVSAAQRGHLLASLALFDQALRQL